MFTVAEINQNIFVHAAMEAGLELMTWDDVRKAKALTGSLTNELENDFSFGQFGVPPLPAFSPEQAASILADLSGEHDFVFYKYQFADLISHTGRMDLARQTFATIEKFVGALLDQIDTEKTVVVVTSDHGHLEQVGFSEGHPKSKVPTWYFGPECEKVAEVLEYPQGIFNLFDQVSTMMGTSDRATLPA